jgi:hypothetical protein
MSSPFHSTYPEIEPHESSWDELRPQEMPGNLAGDETHLSISKNVVRREVLRGGKPCLKMNWKWKRSRPRLFPFC